MLQTVNIFQKDQRPRYLIGMDYDGTLFSTHLSSPNGINVKEAYYRAISDIFGYPIAEMFLISGLQNRAPSEIIADILHAHRSGPEFDEARVNLLARAHSFFETQEGHSGYFIPECKNGEVEWNEKSPVRTVTEMLVGRKLHYLLDEIGQSGEDGEMWPQPCGGALDFLKIAGELHEQGYPLDVAIISSGHDSFIEKSLDVWNVPKPQILVTDDDIRPRTYPLELERRVKPGQIPLALAHLKWLKQQGLLHEDSLVVQEGKETKTRIAYIGDDIEKDLLMAHRGKVRSYLYPWTSWQDMTESLWVNKDLLDGRPITEILPLTPGEREGRVALQNSESQRSLRSGERA